MKINSSKQTSKKVAKERLIIFLNKKQQILSFANQGSLRALPHLIKNFVSRANSVAFQ